MSHQTLDLHPFTPTEQNLDREQFLHWLHQIYTTGEAELDCERLQVALPAYVDFEVAHGDTALADERFAPVLAHLAQCPDCAEEHEALRAVARLEAQGRLPQVIESLAQFETAPAPEATETIPA